MQGKLEVVTPFSKSGQFCGKATCFSKCVVLLHLKQERDGWIRNSLKKSEYSWGYFFFKSIKEFIDEIIQNNEWYVCVHIYCIRGRQLTNGT